MSLSLLGAGPSAPEAFPAGTFMEPTSDDSVMFARSAGANNFGIIDQEVRSPAAPSTSDYLYSSAHDDRDTYGLSNPGVGASTSVKLWVYAWTTSGSGYIEMELYPDGGGMENSGNKTVTTTPAWHSWERSGALSEAELNNTTAGFVWNTDGVQGRVAAFYIEIDPA